MSISEALKNFFGFNKIPFSKTISLNEIFKSASFTEALSHLELALENEDAAMLTGPIGSGKSNVLRYFCSNLDPHSFQPIYIPAAHVKIGEIAKKALFELKNEVPYHGSEALRLLKQVIINLYHTKGIKPILILDEAQDLPLPTILTLRNLLNYAMDSQNILLIILAGQTTLIELLELSPLESLSRRIRIRYHLGALTLEETSSYIAHCLKHCGLTKPLFTDDTKAQIYSLSKGIISKINHYCFELIIFAAAASKDIIEPSMLDKIENR